MIIVEEETQRIFNLYGDDKQPIQKYGYEKIEEKKN